MKKYLFIIAILFSRVAFCQVGIVKSDQVPSSNFPDPSSIVDVRSEDKGFLAPRVALVAVADPSPITFPKLGLVVYNTTDNNELDKGYYNWNGIQWYPWRKSSNTIVSFQAEKISVTTLGYLPIGKGATAPQQFIQGDVVGTKVGCFKFSTGTNATGHSYCGYNLKDLSNNLKDIDWLTAFSIAKNLNGYLVTATSTEEWNYIKTNLLATNPNAQNQSAIWLGFNKVTSPGNPLQFTWITGEKSMVAWERAGITGDPYFANASFEFNFASGEPNNAGNNEGCVQINPGADGNDRLWSDVPCNNANANFLIVEYQN